MSFVFGSGTRCSISRSITPLLMCTAPGRWPLAYSLSSNVHQQEFFSRIHAALHVRYRCFLDPLARVVDDLQKLRRVLRHEQNLRAVSLFSLAQPRRARPRFETPVESFYLLVFALAARGKVAAGHAETRGSRLATPARKRLPSRTRVRTPSITGGIGSCASPRMRKMTSAGCPGPSALEPIPKPCTPRLLIHSSRCAACTACARAISSGAT